MLSLRAEIAACLFAVSLLGLLTGWMIQRARGGARLRRTVAAMEAQQYAAEVSAREDISHLEDRIQEFGEEIKTLTAENRELREGAGSSASMSDDEEVESAEQSRRQIETQERLQRIIREREREIATLRAGLAGRNPSPATGFAMAPMTTGASLRPGADANQIAAADGLDETVRIDPSLLPIQVSAQVSTQANNQASTQATTPGTTVEPGTRANGAADGLSTADVHALRPGQASGANDAVVPRSNSGDIEADEPSMLEDTLESTMDVAFLDSEESTIALDEEALSLVRGLGRGERKR